MAQTQETGLMEIGTKMNGLIFDPVAKNLEIISASLQITNKLLQDALDAGATSIAAGRKFLEAVQKASLQIADATVELPKANVQAFIKMAESLQKTNLPY